MRPADARCELTPDDRLYPSALHDLPDPPRRLYVRGDPAVLGAPSLAVVGSRRATPYGIAVAEMAATVAAQSCIVVVSGGAMGCDQAAGRAALAAGGRHVVVFGSGADVLYPRSAGGLVSRTLARGGAVVSIAPWGAEPRRYAFPKRNRVIAALSRAVCICEAGMPSGTFSTAEAAFEIGREVLAAPGSILSPESRGSNYLIANGACCLTDEESIEMAVSRIFGVLRYERASPEDPAADDRERRAMAALIACPLRIDELAAAIGLDPMACLTYVSGLQMDGRVERLPDGRFAPTKTALHARSAIMHNG